MRFGSIAVAAPAAAALGIALLLAVALLSPALPTQSGTDTGPASAGPVSPAIQDLRATLRDDERALPDGRVAWMTVWQLCWRPIPGAAGYAVTPVSYEGPGRPFEVREPCYALGVANGIDDRPGQRSGRSAQLGLMSSSLSVSVAVRYKDGTLGPASPDYAVGEELR